MSPYFDAIGVVGWLNEKLGTRMTVPEFLNTWTDHDVQMHLHYFDVMDDPAIREAVRFHEAKKRGGGFKLIEGGKD